MRARLQSRACGTVLLALAVVGGRVPVARPATPEPPIEVRLRIESGALDWSLEAHADVAILSSEWRSLPAGALATVPFERIELFAGQVTSGRVALHDAGAGAWVEVRMRIASGAGTWTMGAATRAAPSLMAARIALEPSVAHPPGRPGAGPITATFLYEDRLLDERGYSGAVQLLPLRYADVELLADSTDSVLARGCLDAAGHMSLAPAPPGRVWLQLRSTTRLHPRFDVQVLEPEGEGAEALSSAQPHTLRSEPFELPAGGADLGTAVLRDPDGYGPVQAFHILDVTLDALEALGSGSLLDAAPTRADSLRLYWGPSWRLRSTSSDGGHIEVASPGSGDTDGWSDGLLLHEIGHFAAQRFLGDASPGGLHLLGDVEQDLRLAWSEGFATAFACWVRAWRAAAHRNAAGEPADDRVALFVNAGLPPPDGVPGGLQYAWDVEGVALGGEPLAREGIGSEANVAGILWDLLDDASTPDGRPGDDDPAEVPGPRLGAALAALRGLPAEAAPTFEDFWIEWRRSASEAERESLSDLLAAAHVEFVPDAAEPDAPPAAPARLLAAHAFEAEGAVVISEVLPGTQVAVELVNRAATAQALAGWQLVARSNSSSTNPALTYALPAGAMLGPGARLVVHRGGRARDDTARDLFAANWTVPWFPGVEGALSLLDPTGRGMDFLRWSAWDGTRSSTAPPAGTGWSGDLAGPEFAASLMRRGEFPDRDLAADFEPGEPTLGAPNDTPSVHRTFFPERDQDVFSWEVDAGGVYTLATRRLRDGAVPRIEIWRPGLPVPSAVAPPVSRAGNEVRISLQVQAGERFEIRSTHIGTSTRFGVYEVALYAEPDARLPLPPQGLQAAVAAGPLTGRVQLVWWNAAAYDSLHVHADGNAWQRLGGAAQAWNAELPAGRHDVELVAFARGVPAAAPRLVVAVEPWPASLVEEFEALDADLWDRDGEWGLEAAPGRAGLALVSRPGGPYHDDQEGSVRLRAALRAEATTTLAFDHICIVRPEDVAQVERSDDWGATWQVLRRFDWNAHSGAGENADWGDGRADSTDWVGERLPLPPDRAGRPVQIRFALASDVHGTAAGWFVDHLRVQTAPSVPSPIVLRLEANAPNPFNAGTRIPFDVSEPAHVVLRVLDVGGRVLCQLLDADLPQGPHAVVWDGRDASGRPVASGVYLDQIRAGGEVRARKLVVVR